MCVLTIRIADVLPALHLTRRACGLSALVDPSDAMNMRARVSHCIVAKKEYSFMLCFETRQHIRRSPVGASGTIIPLLKPARLRWATWPQSKITMG